MTVLTDQQIDDWVRAHPAWNRDGDSLSRSVQCATFPAALELVQRVGEVAEQRDHHPDMDIRWRTVRFTVSTHSEGGITEKDTALAETIDELAGDQAG